MGFLRYTKAAVKETKRKWQSHFGTVDGRNRAPPKKLWNINKQRFRLVSNCRERVSSMDSITDFWSFFFQPYDHTPNGFHSTRVARPPFGYDQRFSPARWVRIYFVNQTAQELFFPCPFGLIHSGKLFMASLCDQSPRCDLVLSR